MHRAGRLLFVAVQHRAGVVGVDAAQLVKLLEHRHQRAGAAAAFAGQLDGAAVQRNDRFDAQRAADDGDRKSVV